MYEVLARSILLLTKQKSGLMIHVAEIVQNDANGHFLKITILDEDFIKAPPLPRTLKAYQGIHIVNGINGHPH